MNVRPIAAAALAIAVARSSSPSGFQAFGDTLFFSASDAPFVFTDPTLTAGSPIKSIHMQELREAVKSWR